jgi:DNA-binding transcriptional MerR regulator
MADQETGDDTAEPRYRSSAAARMVNIPVATLRVWERRYQVIGPVQAPSGHRLYSSRDVRRLVLIKQLVNRGHGIGMLARLDTPRLQDMVDEADLADGLLQRPRPDAHPDGPGSAAAVRLLLVGDEVGERWQSALQAQSDLCVVGQVVPGAASELAMQNLQADLLLAEVGSMHMDTVDWLVRLARAVGAKQMLVVYGFANSQVTEALRARSVILRRAPYDVQTMVQDVLDAVRGWRSVAQALRTIPEPAPSPRFDAADLLQLTRSMPRVACECPQHLADLVTMLGRFESYSADCESRHPADVALHAYLYRVAGHARALMEEALATLAQAEGVSLPA